MEWELLKVVAALVGVLGLMVGVVFAMKKFLYGGTSEAAQVVPIEILSQKALQPKRTLYVVKVLNKLIVLGSTEQGLQRLSEIDDESVLESIEELQEHRRQEKRSAFSDFTHKLYKAETLGDFFHKPFNVILWRGDKPGVGPVAGSRQKVRK